MEEAANTEPVLVFNSQRHRLVRVKGISFNDVFSEMHLYGMLVPLDVNSFAKFTNG